MDALNRSGARKTALLRKRSRSFSQKGNIVASNILDNQERIAHVDPTGMLKWTCEFADHWRDTFRRAEGTDLPRLRNIDNVILCGMGGSAIAGDFLRSYLVYNSIVPFEVCRNYRLPGYASPRSLVIISSYSGTTEETLAAYREAVARNCQVYTISTGTEKDVLKRIAVRNGHGHFDLTPGYQPRAATAFSFVPLLVFFEKWGLAPPQKDAIKETIDVLDRCIADYGVETPADKNLAKQIAFDLQGKLPILYAAVDHMAPVAVRWQTQINENSKMLAHVNILPEMNHNEILGWPVTTESIGPKYFERAPLYPDGEPVRPQKDLLPLLSVLYLLDKDDHPRTIYRFEVMKRIISTGYGVPVRVLESRGDGLLARMFSLVSLGDFVSVYLGILSAINPTPVTGIDYLKENLAGFEG